MAKHVVKVERVGRSFRLVIPRKIILEKGWGDVEYILVEDHHNDKIVIRSLFDDEDFKRPDC